MKGQAMSRISSRKLLCLVTSLGMMPASAATQCPPLPPNTNPVGHILTVQGRWRLKSHSDMELQPGCQLEPGAEILPPPRFAEGVAKIAVLDRSGTLRIRACNANQDCGASLLLPSSLPTRPGIWASLVEEVMRKLRGAPDRYVSTISMDYGELNDAVVVQSGAGVNLTPVMKGLTSADYELQFTRIVPVHWNGTAVTLNAGLLSAGLFQVRRKDQSSTDSWVLILPAGDAAEESLKREAELRAVMNGWRQGPEGPDTEGRNAKRTLYRAFLASEAERTGAPR